MMNPISFEEAVERLLAGGVGVLPTDTVYGLVARAVDRAAVARLYALKRREHKPGTVIAASVEQLVELGVPERYLQRVEKWWPGPVSVIVPGNERLEYLHAGLGDFPVRIPAVKELQEFLDKTGPLVTSSANQPGEPPAENVGQAWGYFGEAGDFYVDGGNLRGRLSSTLIRLSADGQLEVLRQGPVSVN